MSRAQYTGAGLYTISDAARLLGVHPSTLRSWVRTGEQVVSGRSYTRAPVITRSQCEDEPLTFAELVELMFIRLFRKEDVSMQTIRKAARRAAVRYGSEYPFTERQFDTDGHHIFETLREDESSEEMIEDIARGQYAFATVVRPFFRKLDYGSDGTLSALWPREPGGRVVLDPCRDFGMPIDAATGVPTSVLFAAASVEGETPENVSFWFDVPVEAVIAAIEFEEHPQVL